MSSSSALNEHFRATFKALFGGGRQSCSCRTRRTSLTCGIDIVAQPPGKKLQLLSLLSGGERALTAIAILFAMLDIRPTPFCILDEIEAALDDANIDNFAHYLSRYCRNDAVHRGHAPQGHHGALRHAVRRGDGGKGRKPHGFGRAGRRAACGLRSAGLAA